jgi:hypothetical protein
MDMKDLARLGAQARIAELIAEIESLMEAFPGIGKAPAHIAGTQPGAAKRRKMSAATKAKISASWARRKAGSAQAAAEPADSVATPSAKKKRVISSAGRERIAAAQRKRWAAVKKTKKKR